MIGRHEVIDVVIEVAVQALAFVFSGAEIMAPGFGLKDLERKAEEVIGVVRGL